MFRFHPHVGGINATTGPIFVYKNVTEFVAVLQRLVGVPVAENDVTFCLCKLDSDGSPAFLEFARTCGWTSIYAVCVEQECVIQVGYSDKAFGRYISEA